MAARLATAALVVLLQVCSGGGQQDYEYDGYGKTVTGIERCGFSAERHEVTSRDGYTTSVFRMRLNSGSSGDPPVLLHHGFLSSSDSWFQLDVNSLPCLLANEGFDVWLANARGNSYSKMHSTYSTESLGFWAFSFHEMAVFDVSATIDYIRSVSKRDRVSYVGHSMGATLMLVLLSVLPDYNRKVDVAVSFAPVCFMSHTTSHLLRLLAYTAPYFEKPLNWLTNGEIPPFPDRQGTSNDGFDFQIGAALGEILDYSQMLQREMALDTEPSGYLTDGSSLRTALHLAQLITRGNFSWYDYGKKNAAEYRRQVPPNYKLRRITARQVIMYSDADYLVVEKDVRRLCSELTPGVAVCHKVNKTGFAHADFLSCDFAPEYVYSVLLAALDREPTRPRGRGRHTTLPEEDWGASPEEEMVAISSDRGTATSLARGRGATIPALRGRASNSAVRLRSPSSPEQQLASPVRGIAPQQAQQEWAASSQEEEMDEMSPELGKAEPSAQEDAYGDAPEPGRAAVSSTRGRVATPPARQRAAPAQGRILIPRVRTMKAVPPEPEADEAAPDEDVDAPAPERKTAARSRGRGGGGRPQPSPVGPRPASREEADPYEPAKVCRYYATAGRLQRVCYEEYA